MLDFIMTYLDPLSVVLGLITTIPIFWTWYQVVFGEGRRRRRVHRELREQTGARPGIIILDLLKSRDARMQVEHFRQRNDALKAIPEARIITISRSHHLSPDDMPDLQREIREAANTLMQQATDRFHVFLAGPLAAAAMVGAEYANMPVMVYQYDAPSGQYMNFGPLRLPL